MKIIITERQQRLVEMDISIRRRLSPGIQYINDLNPNDVCDNWEYNEKHDLYYFIQGYGYFKGNKNA